MYIENTKTLKVLCAKFEAQLDQMNQTSHLGYYRGDKKKNTFLILTHNFFFLKKQCWTVATFFTFGRSRMFGPKKLRPSAVGRSRSRRIKKNVKYMS